MATTMTLEQLLAKTEDGVLLDIQTELLSRVVPTTGYAHNFVRKVNRMIDRGELCINPTTYRKVYLPTLAKAIQREMARRYTLFLRGQLFDATTGNSCEQMTFGLVDEYEQVDFEEAI